MNNWLTSLSAAITISIIALLSFIGYAFLEALYFLGGWITGRAAAAAMTLFVMGIVGGWIWGLMAATAGSRGGLIALFVLCLITASIMLYDIVFYSPIPYGWPLVQIAVWVTFAASVLAILAIAWQLWR